MKETTNEKSKASVFRIILGTLVSYMIFALVGFFIFLAQGKSVTGSPDAVLAWILFPLLSVLILLYSYGWLGMWLSEMEWERNALFRIIGKIFGGLGFLLHPFPLMAFGANKKFLFNLLVALPLAVIGIVLIIFGMVGVNIFTLPVELSGNWSAFYYVLGIFALLNALFAFLAKKCPQCGCLMSKIGYDTLSYESEFYTQQYSRKVGSITDQYGNSADVNELYDIAREGHANKVAKTFTCKRCGTKKQGKARTIHTMSASDHRRNS